MTAGDKAQEYFKRGYNCSQSVAMAFADVIDMDEKLIARLMSGFGGGIGRMREVCGTVSGITFVLSALYGYDGQNDFEKKKAIYGDVQKCAEKFKSENGSIVCRELLGLSKSAPTPATPEIRTSEYYKKRPCVELVKCAADILEEFLHSQDKQQK